MTMDFATHRAQSPGITSDFSLSGRSAWDMPVEGSKLAPKTFKGDPAEVDAFLRKFERVAIQHSLTDLEKCEMITDYCTRRVRETIEGFKAHAEKNWEALREKIRTTWNADLDTRRYRVRDLEQYIQSRRHKRIRDIQGWQRYF